MADHADSLAAFFADHKRIDWNELSKREEKEVKHVKKGKEKKKGKEPKESKEPKKTSGPPCRVLIRTSARIPMQSLYFFIGGEQKLTDIKRLDRSDGAFYGDWLVSLTSKAVVQEIQKRGLLHGARLEIHEL